MQGFIVHHGKSFSQHNAPGVYSVEAIYFNCIQCGEPIYQEHERQGGLCRICLDLMVEEVMREAEITIRANQDFLNKRPVEIDFDSQLESYPLTLAIRPYSQHSTTS